MVKLFAVAVCVSRRRHHVRHISLTGHACCSSEPVVEVFASCEEALSKEAAERSALLTTRELYAGSSCKEFSANAVEIPVTSIQSFLFRRNSGY